MSEQEVIEAQEKEIREVLEFHRVAIEELEVSVKGEEVNWKAKPVGFDYSLSGVYSLSDPDNIRISIIMVMALGRHVYGQYIFDLLRIVALAMHATPSRNSVAEVIIRFMVMQGFKKGVPKHKMMSWLDTTLNISQNINEQNLFHEALRKSPRKN